MKKTLTFILTLLIISGMSFAQQTFDEVKQLSKNAAADLTSDEMPERVRSIEIPDEILERRSTDHSKTEVTVFHENFSDDVLQAPWAIDWPPPGWRQFEFSDDAWRGWSQSSNSYSSSGAAYHQHIAADAKSWLISPQINLPDSDSLLLGFFEKNFWMEDYGYSGVLITTEVIDWSEVDPDDEDFVFADFAELFEELYESDKSIEYYTEKLIDLAEYKGESVYIAFVYEGNDAHDWWVDEMKIWRQYEDDFSVTRVRQQPAKFFHRVSTDTLVTFNAVVNNRGTKTQSKEVTLTIYSLPAWAVVDVLTVETDTIAFGETQTVVFEWETPEVPGMYYFEAEVPADDFTTNDWEYWLLEFVEDDRLAADFELGWPAGWTPTGGWTRFGWDVWPYLFDLGGWQPTGGVSAGIMAKSGIPETILYTRPFELDGTINSITAWAEGLNGGFGLGDPYLEVRIRKLDNNREWEDWQVLIAEQAILDYRLAFYYLVGDLSGFDHGIYQVGYVVTRSTFSHPTAGSYIFMDYFKGPNTPSIAANIVEFDLGDDELSEPVINNAAATVEVFVKHGTDVTKLNPTVTISDDAIITPHPNPDWPSGEVDFSMAQSYRVTSLSGLYKDWAVSVKQIFNIAFEIEDAAGNAITDAELIFRGDTIDAAPYAFTAVPVGEFGYVVNKEGYFTTTGKAHVRGDETIPVTLRIDDTYVEGQDVVDLVVYPNPARDRFTVEAGETIRKIKIISINGQVVKDVNVDAQRIDINVSDMRTGVYFMQIFTANSVVTERVQITR